MGSTGQSITLANSIIGVGILAMPFCFQQCGVLLATLILLSMGLVSRLCCYYLLKSALLARRRNFEFLAFHVFGPTGKLLVELGIIGFLMGTCIAYFVVVGDLGPQIVSKMFNINQSDILRTSIMVIVSLVCVLPLGLLRNVDSLSNVSAATICFYFCLVMKVIAEAASQLLRSESSDWHRRIEMWKPSGLLQCVPIFSMALFCQTQLFEIFESLPSLSLEKMNIVTKNAINICTGVYFTLGLFGYIAFSTHDISGNVLVSLSPTMASDVIKLGFVMSVAFSFPLIIFPCRASLYSFLYKKVHLSHHDHIINHSIPETTFRCITVAIIVVALFISLLIPNIELVLGLVGSTIGVLVCVVFPAACFINLTFKDTNERLLAKGIVVLGLIILVLGTYANLQAAENKHEKIDEKFITQERIDKMVEDFFEQREKSNVLAKNLHENNQNALENIKHEEIIRDSVIQPPNPIPPDSNEKPPEVAQIPIEPKLKEIPPIAISKENEQTSMKVSEQHPKDVQTKLNEAKLVNGDNNSGIKEIKSKEDKTKETKHSEEDKLHIIKQQKLIETMKQHGEEQNELMKEIFDDIIKTKQEIQQNKNEVETKDAKIAIDNIKESDDAKKIAVESIKQIANIAIQSIGGVTEKPSAQDKDIKKSEQLEKLTNEAVQEIAKKAVETIEAIQEIKESPEKQAAKIENVPVQGDDKEPKQHIDQKEVPNIPPIQNSVQNNVHLVPLQNNIESQNKQNNVLNPNIKTQVVSNADPIPVQNNFNEIKLVTPKKVPIYQQVINNDKVAEKAPLLPNNNPQKEYSLDKPKSSKQAEDIKTQNIVKPNIHNVPLPLVMNGQNEVNKKSESAINLANIKSNSDNKANKIEPIVSRQKREIVDCTEKATLQQEDKEVCKNLIDNKPEKINHLPKIDLDDLALYKNLPIDSIIDDSKKKYDLPKVDFDAIALSKKLPMDSNIIEHIGRSLKSYDEFKDR
ncbi:hypothetical protein K1T71_006284 [Dendrolimus kikuchii]|uniref:Uncharacterized protein n=1 Tax=Dendrolimus kikuchii TaxID=765133 RepID=A0ACC1D3R9_9NEOP|nr:hypothetical protein K1T71_006284 [Dendrolimus kikuchii]